ncbi:CDP-glycerol glycerophosphotransferase family protein [Amnibacterium sp. CER49]|uniref:CDP-glycerol glycerophosphotransferase family protein n=1 Tax=Amnibacterium sp. CER49 TaxID=3039161 RepID=UPI00244CE753|nr:CDP-glycerol glycerophosphotransferase family protein [Amnibacterium sp. CER49]MDH2444401.1 CDP-glycerol glycerophosphotransferase family protein [Amnibacterium sp. CER49]
MPAPLVSVIAPMYGVERYLPDFLASIEAQTVGLDRLDVVLVDDGSPDGSAALAEAFAARHPGSVQVVRKENGGQASARNAGIERARGDWLCFLDPDDVIEPQLFAELFAFMEQTAHLDIALYAGHVVFWDEVTGEIADTHPHGFRFKSGNTVANLAARPNFIHGQLLSSLFRADIVRDHSIRFDERLRSAFEDGKFVAEYLLLADEPTLGLVDRAVYRYRKRADGSSTNQNYRYDPRTYTDVPRYGYLELLRTAREQRGSVPHWLQNLVAYNVFWLFKMDWPENRISRAVDQAVLDEFARIMRDVVGYLEDEVIFGFDMMAVPGWMKQALAHGYRDEPFVDRVTVSAVDDRQDLARLVYYFGGPLPSERFWSHGRSAEPRHSAVRPVRLVGTVLLKERIVWIDSAGQIRARLNGAPVRFANWSRSGVSDYKLRVPDIRRIARRTADATPARFRQQTRPTWRLAGSVVKRALLGAIGWGRRELSLHGIKDILTWLALRSPVVRARYGKAWLLMDKNNEAGDSAEELYRWIRANHPGRNVWFTLDKRSSDYRRLQRDGFRIVPFRSFRWLLLILSATVVASSHADAYVTNPLDRRRFGPPQFRFVFLQHGVIKGDLSPWLNRKSIDMIVASTEPEYGFLAGDTPYALTTKEVRLTGLPRHDALRRRSAAMPESAVRDILIAPTWREHLVGKARTSSTDRHRNADFMRSEYAQAWGDVLRSPRLLELARRGGYRIVFLPHPNIQPYLDEFDLPKQIVLGRYGDIDVQDAVIRSAVLVTDYSSMAFNAAYLERPVAYFQFDEREYIANHTEGPGYYDYRTDGFGPVATTADELVAGIESVLEDADVRRRYAEVARRTFPVRDGRNSARVYDAILDLGRPVPRAVAHTRAVPETWAALTGTAPRPAIERVRDEASDDRERVLAGRA